MPSMLDTLELLVREAPRRLMGTPAAMRGRFGTREARGYEPTTTSFTASIGFRDRFGNENGRKMENV